MTQKENYALFLLVGKSGSGKTSSLRNMPLEKTVIINAEAKSMLPFKNSKSLYKNWVLTDITKFMKGIDILINDDNVEYIVIDSLTFLMSMYELQVVNKSTNTMRAWGEYAVFYKELIHKLKTCNKNIVITAHPVEAIDENSGVTSVFANIKGSLKGIVEADFNVVAYTYNTTSEDGLPEYKLLVKKTKETIGWSVKSPFEMFEDAILPSNDVMLVFDAIKKFDN